LEEVAPVSSERDKIGLKGSLGTKLVITGSLLVVILYTIYAWIDIGSIGTYQIWSDATAMLGKTLFEEWGIVVLVLGLILFATMIGGVFIAQEDDE
jgi:NADH:ubiquinone oxidoreductase subunit 6 (subunit J)